jgi:hypothetical protein
LCYLESNLKNKSGLNRAAADVLLKSNYYPSVIHCSYYSCVQLMKHNLIFIIGKTESQLIEEQRKSNEGSHEVLINNTIIYLKSNNKDWKTFNTNINQLKKLRIESDYSNINIDSDKGRKSLLLTDSVLKILNK